MPRNPKWPCGTCHSSCLRGQDCIFCAGCTKWFHRQCQCLTVPQFRKLGKMDPDFWCQDCCRSKDGFDFNEQVQMECEDINRNSNHNLLTDSSKRQRVDGVSGLVQFNGPTYGATSQYSGRSFIPIKSSMHTFHSEEVKAEGHTLYTPLLDDTLLNIRIVEQITFESGLYHIGSSTGAYERNSEGYTIMLWKYSEKLNKIFVSRSILFTSREEYWAVRSMLELM